MTPDFRWPRSPLRQAWSVRRFNETFHDLYQRPPATLAARLRYLKIASR